MLMQISRRYTIAAILFFMPFLVVVVSLHEAGAQEPGRGETVTNRVRPEIDPLGIRMGGFVFFPQLGVATKYDDNIFATKTDEIDDTIYLLQPQIALRSNWNNHALNFIAGAEAAYYNENDSEDYVDSFIGAEMRLDASRDGQLSAAIMYSKLHQGRDSPDEENGVEPTEYTLLAADAGYAHDFGFLSVEIGAALDRYDYDNNRLADNTPIINDDRDRDQKEGSLRLGIDVSEAVELFVRGTYFVASYVDEADEFGRDRDSTGYEAVAGAAFDLTGVTFGEIFAGYRAQDPDDPAFDTIEGPQYGGAISWNPSGLTTVKGEVVRLVEETTEADAPGYFSTTANLTLDHELLRNLILGAGIGYSTRKYDGIDRDDSSRHGRLSAKYMMNRHLYVSLNYNYADLDSNIDNEDYTKNVVMLRLQAQY